jgi:hypothetical protein
VSTSFSTSVDVPADVETAYAALTGPEWPGALDARLHDDSRLVSATPAGDGLVLVVSRKLPDQVPAMLQSFLPADGRVSQTDTWGPATGGVRRGTWAVAMPKGTPGEIGGDLTLEPTSTGCRWTVAGAVGVRIPLAGGRIERYLAPLLAELTTVQGEVLTGLVRR